MTIADLIEKLKKMPADAVVVIDMCSECRELDDDEPRLERAEDKVIFKRGQVYITWSKYLRDTNPEPEFVTVCHFPGN